VIEGIPLGVTQLGAGGLLGIGIILVLTGRLLWHKVAEQMIAAVRAENERLWIALTAQQEINRQYAETARDTEESIKTITLLVRAIPRKEQETP
jgi:hypothetical protein